jgi:hypothetical protein
LKNVRKLKIIFPTQVVTSSIAITPHANVSSRLPVHTLGYRANKNEEIKENASARRVCGRRSPISGPRSSIFFQWKRSGRNPFVQRRYRVDALLFASVGGESSELVSPHALEAAKRCRV